VLWIGQAGRVHEMAVLHAQALRLTVHHLREVFLAAGDGFGQRDAGVVTGLDDHALDQVFGRHLRVDPDEHLGAAGAPGLFGNGQGLGEGDGLVADGREGQVGRHQLGQRGRFEAFIRLLGGQHLVGAHFQQQPGLGG
jgi:hypothetical protein